MRKVTRTKWRRSTFVYQGALRTAVRLREISKQHLPRSIYCFYLLCVLVFSLNLIVSAAWAQNSGSLSSQAAHAFEAGDYSRAANLFRKLVAAEPRNALGWYFLGQSLQQTGNKAAASKAYQSALSITGTASDLGRKIFDKIDSMLYYKLAFVYGRGENHSRFFFVSRADSYDDALNQAMDQCNSNNLDGCREDARVILSGVHCYAIYELEGSSGRIMDNLVEDSGIPEEALAKVKKEASESCRYYQSELRETCNVTQSSCNLRD